MSCKHKQVNNSNCLKHFSCFSLDKNHLLYKHLNSSRHVDMFITCEGFKTTSRGISTLYIGLICPQDIRAGRVKTPQQLSTRIMVVSGPMWDLQNAVLSLSEVDLHQSQGAIRSGMVDRPQQSTRVRYQHRIILISPSFCPNLKRK